MRKFILMLKNIVNKLLSSFMILLTLFFTLTILFLPLIILSNRTSLTIDDDATYKIYYICSIMNVVWIVFISWLFRKYIDMNSKIINVIIRLIKFIDSSSGALFGVIAAIQLFSGRTIIYSIYLLVLFLAQLNENGIIQISNQYLFTLIKINQHAIVILIAVDRILSSFNKDRSKLAERFNKMIEVVLH